MTLWLWLMLLPASIGLSTSTWSGRIGLAAGYFVTFALTTFLASLGDVSIGETLAVIGLDATMILAVAASCHGLLRAFRKP